MKKQQVKQEKKHGWMSWVLVGLSTISILISTALLISESKTHIILCRVKSADPITGLIELECAK